MLNCLKGALIVLLLGCSSCYSSLFMVLMFTLTKGLPMLHHLVVLHLRKPGPVGPKAGGIFQFQVPHSQVTGSSCKPNDVWCLDDSCSSLFAYTAFSNFKADDASHCHTVAIRNCLWFGWEVLHRYFGRKRILLAFLLGDSMHVAFPLKCLYVGFVLHSSWTC